MEQVMDSKRKPDKEFVDWPIRCSVWLRGEFFSTRVTRSFKNKNDPNAKWETTDYLNQEDLLRAARLLERAYDWSLEVENERRLKDKTAA